MKTKNVILLLLLIGNLVGCSAYEGFVETPFDQWQTKRFSKIGLSVDFPKNHLRAEDGAYLVREYADIVGMSRVGYNDIDVRMHPVWLGFMIEPFYRIEINIVRVPEEKNKDFASSKLFAARYDCFYDSHERFINEMEMYPMTTSGYGPDLKDQQWLILRKDYRDKTTGDYIVTGAKIFAGWDEFVRPKQQDIDAVSRILKSVKVIGSGVRLPDDNLRGAGK